MGSSMPNPPSRFLKDIPASLIEAKGSYTRQTQQRVGRGLWEGMAQRPTPRPTPQSSEGAGLRTGDHVRHQKFGEGIVVTATGTASGDQEVTVAFRTAGLKKLLASFARLEKT
jgi:DNA helicase-2/ATP-dependent DNA helicase PcrA